MATWQTTTTAVLTPSVSPGMQVEFDQAIFTSVRTPMGEGYQLIGAGPGLSSAEKQAITRSSPSHDALCDPSSDAIAVGCYPLPGGRMCIAHTCRAGLEQTGRGQRIYTYNLVVSPEGFARFSYNPFHIIRAAQQAGLTLPQLKPKPQIEPVQLNATGDHMPSIQTPDAQNDDHLWQQHVLQGLLDSSVFVVRLQDAPVDAGELLWLSLPGPMRLARSISVGLRFSAARCHDCNIVTQAHDGQAATAPDKHVECVDASNWNSSSSSGKPSAWVELAASHWCAGTMTELSEKTARPFFDLTRDGLDRIVSLYRAEDEAEHADPALLVALVEMHRDQNLQGAEAQIMQSLVSKVSDRLLAWVERAHLTCIPAGSTEDPNRDG